MNNINMSGMPQGPSLGPPSQMGNGLPRQQQRPMPNNESQQRTQLNTYIYEYFISNEMWDCARAIVDSKQPINTIQKSPTARDHMGLDNGDDPSNDDSKANILDQRGLPLPNLPRECPESCFLYEWWCLFWDMFNAQRGKEVNSAVHQYAAHTQVSSDQLQ